MSTLVVAVLVTVLVVGIVVAMFAVIYVWEKWGRGSRVERWVDRFFDRLSDMFDR
jgi:heme/copper-type cytochrome/quinol oxidase subunit 1